MIPHPAPWFLHRDAGELFGGFFHRLNLFAFATSASTDPERSGSIFSIVLPTLHTTSAASTPPRACPGQA